MHQPVDTRRARLSVQREVCGGDVPVKNAARTLARKVSNGWRCDKKLFDKDRHRGAGSKVESDIGVTCDASLA